MRICIAISSILVLAAANPTKNTGLTYCKVVNKLVTVARAQTAATAFCSSYLSLPPQETIFVFSSAAPRGQSTTCRTPAPTTAPMVKAAKAVPRPDCFAGHLKPSQISSACSCLSIPTATTTTATDFKIVASGGPANGNYASKNSITVTAVAFNSFRENALTWSLINGQLTAGDGSGIAYLSQCGQSSGPPYCDNPNVLLGSPTMDQQQQSLYCQVLSNLDQTCRIDCNIGGGEQDYVSDNDSHVWRINYQDDVNAFTPIIGPV